MFIEQTAEDVPAGLKDNPNDELRANLRARLLGKPEDGDSAANEAPWQKCAQDIKKLAEEDYQKIAVDLVELAWGQTAPLWLAASTRIGCAPNS